MGTLDYGIISLRADLRRGGEHLRANSCFKRKYLYLPYNPQYEQYVLFALMGVRPRSVGWRYPLC